MRWILPITLLAACSSPSDDLAALAEAGASCEADGDCCAVIDGCAATTHVIGRADFEEAKDLAAASAEEGECSKCLAPLVDVRCNPGSKRCEGRAIPWPEAGAAPDGLAVHHCGAVLEDPWPSETGSVTLGCGAQ